ncbi:MAG TPA: UDP-3-O-(3-hydroxymyristoyl)glucosamine N-acyltransferase [Phycisphaerae bacterium]|nr:UDP-3-O-(3-hydroxymyristoyl)glucosamine N-acyltransferase [Phycisphaerae bacterium]
MPTPISLADLATLINGTLIAPDPAAAGSRTVSSCNTLASANEDQVSFLHNKKYADQLTTTKAGLVLLAPNTAKTVQRAEGLPPLVAIEVKDPYYAWQQTLVKLHGQRTHAAVGISAQASIHPTARIGSNVNIHPFALIGENVTIGDNTHIYPHVTLMHDVSIGSDSILYPSVTVYEECRIGNRCILHAGAVVGSDGYGFATHNGIHHKIPQTGNVVIEDDVEIGGNTVIERAVLESTIIGKGSKLGNTVIIGHNCEIGPGNLLVSQVGIAGSTTTGKYVVMAGQVGVAGHLNIPDMIRVAAQSGIMMDPEKPGIEIGGSPAMEASHARRVYLQFIQLPELAKRIKDLEKQLAKLQPPTPDEKV